MRQIRWIVEVSKKDMDDWRVRHDAIYSGWFDSNGYDEEPHAALLEDFNNAKSEAPYLDWRLVQEIRSHERKVVA